MLRPDPVDGILVVSDGLVPTLAAGCKLLGHGPGRDLDLVGYDHYWTDLGERELEPTAPVASIDKLNADCGRALVELLDDRIAGRLPPAPQHRVIMPQLVHLKGANVSPTASQRPHRRR